MTYVHVQTIDGKHLWLNLERVGAFSYLDDEHICLVEISGGEPHQISIDEFSRIEPLLAGRKAKVGV
jgi:hypothetical protein